MGGVFANECKKYPIDTKLIGIKEFSAFQALTISALIQV